MCLKIEDERQMVNIENYIKEIIGPVADSMNKQMRKMFLKRFHQISDYVLHPEDEFEDVYNSVSTSALSFRRKTLKKDENDCSIMISAEFSADQKEDKACPVKKIL